MSSDVHAKWMNSATRAIAGALAKRSFIQYSTALTSWLVVRSIDLTRTASAVENAASASSIAASAAASKAGPRFPARLRGRRPREPTRTRLRISADSKWPQRALLRAVAPVERRQRGQRVDVVHRGERDARPTV
jgi:hypothetical protein